ncbi:MAG: GNAT family N-acetyltransferase [Halofilum sp. (in: g-proteobacteria)]
MAEQGEKILHLPCRLGEITFWSPALRLWVYRAGLFEGASEAEVTERVRAEARRRDGAFLNSLRVSEGRAGLSLRNGFLRYVPQHDDRYVIDLSGSFDDYMTGFATKTRSTLRRKIRRFEREAGGELDVREYRSRDELADFLGSARTVSAQSYQEIMLDAGLPDSDTFSAEALANAEAGQCRGYLLFFEGRPVAYMYCPVRDGVARYAYVGYDQEFASLSPGTVLLLNVLERLHDDPDIHTFDFLEGGDEGSHKAFFANRRLSCTNVFLLRPTPRNSAIVLVHAASRRLSRGLARTLDRLGLKQRIRQAIRRVRPAR